jgi:transcriptional regulator with XRE-family HTH domain
METLGQYVARIMEEKNLSALDIEARSVKAGNRIADSYITNIVRGTSTNLSIEKLNALADGLGVDRVELYKVASGMPLIMNDPWPSNVLLKTMERITQSSELTQLVQRLLTLKPSKIKAILKSIESEKD